jgi:D-alanyl-lipoteichoic acid acyltransferase DltB (MBOAT superfamily)
MLFSTFTFFVFLSILLVLYWFVFSKHLNIQNAFLLLSSYVFYGWWSWTFCGLLLLSTLIDYGFGFWVASPSKQKARLFLRLSIINNLGILFLFKYFNFFSHEFQQGMALLGWNVNALILDWGLPIGISFYTFHGMSYVFDIYRGQQKPVQRFVDYAVFVSFFPLLVAGPIERASHLLPQIQAPRRFSYQQSVEGFRLLLWGLFKKVVIADTLAPVVDSIFGHAQQESGYTLLLGMFGFAIQIYGDFSGYSDMALGMAKLLGFELLSNFKMPILSRDITEFWRRWHISLTSWFRDYLLVALGGIGRSKVKAIRNISIIFLLSGFWHGASWNFIIFGLLHAIAFIPFLIFPMLRVKTKHVVGYNAMFPTWQEALSIALTFSFVSFALLFFRISNWHDALRYIKRMILDSFNHIEQFVHIPKSVNLSLVQLLIIPLMVALVFLSDWYLRYNERSLRVPGNYWIRNSLYFIVATLCLYKMVSMKIMATHVNFIYFQF